MVGFQCTRQTLCEERRFATAMYVQGVERWNGRKYGDGRRFGDVLFKSNFNGTYGQEISEILFGEIVNIYDIKHLPVRHFATNFIYFHCDPGLRRNLDEGRLLA